MTKVVNQAGLEVAGGDDVGRICILCGTPIAFMDTIHRSADGEIVHEGCHQDLNDEDAHFYEPKPKEVV